MGNILEKTVFSVGLIPASARLKAGFGKAGTAARSQQAATAS